MVLKSNYVLTIYLFSWLNLAAASFRLLNLPDVDYDLIPSRNACSPSEFLILVHSAPSNRELRDAIRETWGTVPEAKTVFLLGRVPSPEAQAEIENEHLHYGDILQGSFLDSYRNMTYKHLLGYRWAVDHCPNAPFILKSDDDQVVDTLQLPTYMKSYISPSSRGDFYLCQTVRKARPQRNTSLKWFVTTEEYPAMEYPTYCAGWAYVVGVETMRAVLEAADAREGYFWIDDVFVTGVLRPSKSTVYEWATAFLNIHVQHQHDVTEGTGFSPELMAASDLTAAQIRHVFKKFRRSHEKGIPQKAIYDDAIMLENLRPPIVKDEL